MTLSFVPAELRELLLRRLPFLLYVISWTAVVTTTVAAASFLPEIAFSWAVSSSLPVGACDALSVRLPLDGPPGEVVCVPAQLFGQTKLDLFVPPIFAAAMVACSACFVRAIGLWEAEDEAEDDSE